MPEQTSVEVTGSSTGHKSLQLPMNSVLDPPPDRQLPHLFAVGVQTGHHKVITLQYKFSLNQWALYTSSLWSTLKHLKLVLFRLRNLLWSNIQLCRSVWTSSSLPLPQIFGLSLFNTNSKKVYMSAHCFDWETGLTAAPFDVRPGSDLNQIPAPSISIRKVQIKYLSWCSFW